MVIFNSYINYQRVYLKYAKWKEMEFQSLTMMMNGLVWLGQSEPETHGFNHQWKRGFRFWFSLKPIQWYQWSWWWYDLIMIQSFFDSCFVFITISLTILRSIGFIMFYPHIVIYVISSLSQPWSVCILIYPKFYLSISSHLDFLSQSWLIWKHVLR